MIKSFKSPSLRKLWNDGHLPKRAPRSIEPKSFDRLKMLLSALASATRPEDLRLQGLGFHALKGERRGQFALEIKGQLRITFEWAGSGAINVNDEDHHG